MKTLAFVFCHNRLDTLRQCVTSIFERSEHLPDEIVFIDDASTENVPDLLIATRKVYRNRTKISLWVNGENTGVSSAAVRALAYTRQKNPDHVYFIEGDYVFRPGGLDLIHGVLSETEPGRECMGIVGYDHPNFGSKDYTEGIFPRCMIQQVGEDNVNRSALHKPAPYQTGYFLFNLELASNTCWTSYLNWRQIRTVAAEFPELDDLLDQACAPRDNPNYPDSGKYAAARCVDDGMLSHALSLCWNRWAIKHGKDREKLGAWLNIKPTVAIHVCTGGMHA